MDTLTAKQRSHCMSQIKSRDTKAELSFRRFIWKNNIRGYRLREKLRGKPDLYFPSAKLAVFIDGCFWHRCPRCFVKPKSKNEYWDGKIAGNTARDKETNKLLRKEGIAVLRFWEHEVRENTEKCYKKVKNKLKTSGSEAKKSA